MKLNEESSDFVYLGKRIDKTLNYIQNNKTDLLGWFKQYVESPYLNMISGELEIEEEDYIFDYLDSLVDDLEIKYNTILENKKIMTNEQLRMQMLSGIITEGQYKAKLEENKKPKSKKSLKEGMIGGIVGIGAINQIPPRAKTDYETAFEHFLGGKYDLKENEGIEDKDPDMVDFVKQNFDVIKDNFYETEKDIIMNDDYGDETDIANLEDQLSTATDAVSLIDVINERSIGVDLNDSEEAQELFDQIKSYASLDEGKEIEEPRNY